MPSNKPHARAFGSILFTILLCASLIPTAGCGGDAGAEAEVDASVARQRGFDPDLWVIEVEDRAGRHLLQDEGLA